MLAQADYREAYRQLTPTGGWATPIHLRPDIVVRDRDGEPVVVLDTKYKDLGTKPTLDPSDLYQLTLYSMSLKRNGFVPSRIVYPVRNGVPHETRLEYVGHAGGAPLASVATVALDIGATAAALRRRDREALRGTVTRLLG